MVRIQKFPRLRVSFSCIIYHQHPVECFACGGLGDIEGTQQSGIAFDLKIASLSRDEQLLQYVRDIARAIVDDDPDCNKEHNRVLWRRLAEIKKRNNRHWGAIS